MRKIIFFLLIVCLIFSCTTPLTAAIMTISKSGVYKLRGDVSGSDANEIIKITTSDVELDLGGYSVVQSAANGNGIRVETGLSNITIRNGIIRGTTGVNTANGVYIATGTTCSKIVLEDLRIEKWVSRAIYFDGASGNEHKDSIIRNCHITGNALSTSETVIRLQRCFRIYMSDCLIDNNSRTTANLRVIYLDVCDSCMLKRLHIRENSGASDGTSGNYSSIYGVTVTNSIFSECIMSGNSTSGSSSDGSIDNFILVSTSQKNVIQDCLCSGNSAASVGRNYSFYYSASSQAIFIRCKSVGDSSVGSSRGFREFGSSSKNIYVDCVIDRMSSSSAHSGYGMSGDDALYVRCSAVNNTSTSSFTRGMELDSGTSGCTIVDCYFARNEGGSTDEGIRNDGTNNIFVGSQSYRNGTTSGNQLVGVNNAVASQATAGPWENVGMV